MEAITRYIATFKQMEVVTREEAIDGLSVVLNESGYVKETFLSAVLEREKVHPTGLPAAVGVAIPHTDTEHVLKPALAVGVLENPVPFQVMGNPEENVEVKIVFLLAMKEPQAQLDLLQKLMGLLQNEELLIQLSKSENLEQAKKIFSTIPIGE
ncbi:PTS sugar transporter subunit IIA [Pseudalkalibacillus caeni]|uniref:PTS sugar transporter subunit IIA n=1 Tax=Exobacillus caeni TaxID=2574798 RepID=UPI0014855B4B|nr:PTS sugar transporter subunit IIA [Pseudalkalibacillus caeni]